MRAVIKSEKREKAWFGVIIIMITVIIIALGGVMAKKSVAFNQSGSELEKLDFTPTNDPGAFSFSFSVDNQSYGVLIDGVSNLILQNGNAVDYNGLLWTSVLGVKDLYGQLDNLVTYTNASSDIDLNGYNIANITQIDFQSLQFETPLSSQPTCNSGQGTGGTLWPVFDGTGHELVYMEICTKNIGNSNYNWHNITFDGTSSGISWTDAMNGTLFTQAEYDTNYTTNDPVYKSFVANYSTFLTHITWTNALNGTLRPTTNLTFTGGNATFDSNVLSVDSSSNRVGVGTTTPQNALNVVGDANVTGNTTINNNALFIDSVNHRVGMGTATPQNTLNVVGNINATTNIYASNNVSVGALLVLNYTAVTLPACSATYRGYIMMNRTGSVYGCNNTAWVKIF